MTSDEQVAVRSGPFVEHVTREGERWDQIADRYYGDPLRYEVIVAANPAIAIVPVLAGGLHLLVPVLLDTALVANTADLPPWKR